MKTGTAAIKKINLKPLNVKLGQSTLLKKRTGCTILLFDKPAVCGISIKGGAPATRETDLLQPSATVPAVNGILFAGGSAFGLAAADGAMLWLQKNGFGFSVAGDKIPILPAAVIYDRAVGEAAHPTAKDGEKACKNSSYITQESGKVGAGCGATVGKWNNRLSRSSGGLAVSIIKQDGIFMAAVFVVNAYGNICHPKTGVIIAGAKNSKGAFVPYSAAKASKAIMGNTTIGAVITNARLTKAEAKELATYAHKGMKKVCKPAHTKYDGDAIFAASTGSKKYDLALLKKMAADITAETILKAVR